MSIRRTNGSQGYLPFYSKRTISGQNTTDLSFTGLDGDIDLVYDIRGLLVNGSESQAADITLQPNGISPATDVLLSDPVTSTKADAISATYQDSVWLLGTIKAGSVLGFEITVVADKSAGTARCFWGTSFAPGSGNAQVLVDGLWVEGTTKLTSLVLHSSLASGIGIGSWAVCSSPYYVRI